MRQYYTTAAYALLIDGTDIDTVLAGLRQAMERRGHMGFYPSVVRDLASLWEQYEREQVPTVTLARAADAAKLADTIATQLVALKAPATYRTVIRPELIGGSLLQYNNQVIDGSYKQALLRLYQNVLHPTA